MISSYNSIGPLRPFLLAVMTWIPESKKDLYIAGTSSDAVQSTITFIAPGVATKCSSILLRSDLFSEFCP